MEAARRAIRSAERIVVLTGAGISTDSGIPDFRGPNGVWTKDPEAEKLANIDYYMSDPEIRQRAWRRRLETLEATYEPNDGHRALAAIEGWGTLHSLITQNIDGLHLAAGTSADKLIEVHGTTRDVVCLSCDYRAPMSVALDRVRAGEADPDCPTCRGILKSATISFGQGLVAADLQRADAAARRADLLMAVGSTLSVYPIANVVPIAKSHGALVMIINRGPTEMDDLADFRLEGSITKLLNQLIAD